MYTMYHLQGYKHNMMTDKLYYIQREQGRSTYRYMYSPITSPAIHMDFISLFTIDIIINGMNNTHI